MRSSTGLSIFLALSVAANPLPALPPANLKNEIFCKVHIEVVSLLNGDALGTDYCSSFLGIEAVTL